VGVGGGGQDYGGWTHACISFVMKDKLAIVHAHVQPQAICLRWLHTVLGEPITLCPCMTRPGYASLAMLVPASS
jgi:hypothetical protein